jgi:hypothetical protein
VVVVDDDFLLRHMFSDFLPREYLMIWMRVKPYIQTFPNCWQTAVAMTMQMVRTVLLHVPNLEREMAQDDLLTIVIDFSVILNPHYVRDISVFDHLPQVTITVVPTDEVDVAIQMLDQVYNLIKALVPVESEIPKVIHIIVHTYTSVPAINHFSRVVLLYPRTISELTDVSMVKVEVTSKPDVLHT